MSRPVLTLPRGGGRRAALALAAGIAAGIAIGYTLGAYRGAAGGAIITVNGVSITEAAFHHRLEVAAGPRVLQQMIDEEINLQYAAKEGALPSEREVEARLAENRRRPDYAANLAATHQTEDDARRNLLLNLAQTNLITRGTTATDAEARAFYAANADPRNPKARYLIPETLQVAVVVARSRDRVEWARAELAKGADFAAVARKQSEDDSARDGGVLPPVQRGRARFDRLPGLEPVLFRMSPGQVTGPTKVGATWWIIRCIRHDPARTKPYLEVQEECRRGALLVKGMRLNGDRVAAGLAALRKSARISASRQEYQALIPNR